MNTQARTAMPAPFRIALFAVLVAIGLGYVLSLAWFFRHSSNFVEREGIKAARGAVASHSPALPVNYAFDAKSSWTTGLAYGWNRPEDWGVWADNTTAALVLPPLAGSSTTAVCVRLRFGGVSQRRHWRLAIAIDGKPWGEARNLSGEGPFEMHKMAQVGAGEPIVIRFSGPPAVIPRATSPANPDSRLLSFSLFGITIAKKC